MSEQLHVFSFGGGVQSTACLVLAARGKIPYRIFVMANTGDDSEYAPTLAYVREVATPFAAAQGLELHLIQRQLRDGTPETLLGRLTKDGSRSLPIPVRMSRTGAPGRRSCTADFKIKVLTKWLKERGVTAENPALSGLGISLDEVHRARTSSNEPLQMLDYPLLNLKLRRRDCVDIIQDAGLPVPPKSACWFCPYHSVKEWQRLRHEEPEVFQKSVDLERLLNERRVLLGKDPVYFHSRLKPLERATSAAQQQEMLFGDLAEDACESGHCFT